MNSGGDEGWYKVLLEWKSKPTHVYLGPQLFAVGAHFLILL